MFSFVPSISTCTSGVQILTEQSDEGVDYFVTIRAVRSCHKLQAALDSWPDGSQSAHSPGRQPAAALHYFLRRCVFARNLTFPAGAVRPPSAAAAIDPTAAAAFMVASLTKSCGSDYSKLYPADCGILCRISYLQYITVA